MSGFMRFGGAVMRMGKPIHSFLAGSLFALAAGIGLASAQPVKIGCTATPDCAAAMIAIDEGIFRKHGLEAEMVLVALNSNIPAALLSNSLQFGGPTPSVLLQAIDGGLDLVAVANASVANADTKDAIAILARPDAGIATAKDLVGKKVAVPGFNALLHVLLRQWLMENGVDPKGVQFVEGTFPTMADLLKGGTVDGIILAEPFMSRAIGANVAKVVAKYLSSMPDGESIIIFASDRRWAEANPKTVAAFRAGLAEAAKIAAVDPDKVRAAVAKFLKMPAPAAAGIKPGDYTPAIRASQIAWWLDVMTKQNMLQTKIDPAKVLLK